MRALRTISATLAALLCALGLSVGATLAEGDAAHAPAPAGGHTPRGLCVLRDA